MSERQVHQIEKRRVTRLRKLTLRCEDGELLDYRGTEDPGPLDS